MLDAADELALVLRLQCGAALWLDGGDRATRDLFSTARLATRRILAGDAPCATIWLKSWWTRATRHTVLREQLDDLLVGVARRLDAVQLLAHVPLLEALQRRALLLPLELLAPLNRSEERVLQVGVGRLGDRTLLDPLELPNCTEQLARFARRRKQRS